jgi:hypothetical protein
LNTETYHQTRGDLSPDELQPYSGKWVAFSADGTRIIIIAAAGGLAELDKLVGAAGEDVEQVGYERIDLEDTSVGGAELL